MKKTLSGIFLKITASGRKMFVICAVTAAIVGVLVAGVIMLDRAKATARRLQAYGRLGQMRVALQLYEDDHGTLPPLSLRDDQGNPIQSWRALILPYLGIELSNVMDLSQSWNSEHNRRLIDSVPPGDWLWFAWDRSQTQSTVSTHILAYRGLESIWNGGTGLPKGKTTEYPNAILLIWIPKSDIHPMQPGDITDEEIRERIGKGEEVLFETAYSSGGYGIVTIEQGELVFHTSQQVRERKESQR